MISLMLLSQIGAALRKLKAAPRFLPERKNEAPFNRHVGNPVHPGTPRTHTAPSIRSVLHGLMAETAGNRYGWNYREVRPLSIPPRLAHGVNADCSFGCKILCSWAGAPDPTGGHFDGWGNSTSMFMHCQHIPLAEAKVGDFIVFGPNGSEHATMIFQPDAHNPVLWSHGHQGAPDLYHLADDHRPWTVLRNPVP